MTSALKQGDRNFLYAHHQVLTVKARINQSKKGKSILVTIHEGFSTYTITVPLPYAIRFFSEGLLVGLESLQQNNELQKILNTNEGEKAEIQENLRKSVKLFEDLLKKIGR
jgi:hypothetical protein